MRIVTVIEPWRVVWRVARGVAFPVREVKAESAELANDVVTEAACEAVLGDKAANGAAGEHLMHIHCTDESKGFSGGGTSHKKVLRLTFRLPSSAAAGGGWTAMEEALGDLMPLVPHYIDVVGRVQLTGAQKEKADKARQRRKEEDFKADLKENAQDAARAKQDDKLAKMTPAEKAKWKEKQAKKQLKKSAGKMIMKR